jgi:hypothetical protein
MEDIEEIRRLKDRELGASRKGREDGEGKEKMGKSGNSLH